MGIIYGLVIGCVLGILSAGLGVAWSKYRVYPLVAAIRAAKKNLVAVEHYATDANSAIVSATARLTKQARAYIEAQQTYRLRAISMEKLKEAGATNIRWAALREAGLTTLAHFDGMSERRLMSIPGVGQTTAFRVVRAARSLAAAVRAEPPTPPSPDLETPYEEELAASTLHLLHAKELLDEVPNCLRAEVGKFRGRLKEIRHGAGFGSWILHRGAFAKGVNKEPEAQVLLSETQNLLEGEAVRSTRDRLSFLAEESQNRPLRHRILDEFRGRYADSTALAELFLLEKAGSVTQPSRKKTAGGLPTEIAERAEKVALLSDGLRVTLRQYQVFGAKYLLAQERTILGDEMGLGKTIEALAVMTHLNAAADGSAHFLVVAPASLTRNWMIEVSERTRLRGFLLHGPWPERRRELERWVRLGGVAITSYSMLASLPELATTVPIRFLVVDEAHFAKNPWAKRSGQVRRLTKAASHVCLMTGTPIENCSREFVNLVEMIQPSLARDLADGFRSSGVIGAVRFRERVAVAYLRRNQRDVLAELPDKIEVPEWVDMAPEDAAAYRTAVFERDFHSMRRIAILGAGGRPSSKIERFTEIIDEHRSESRKVLVFTFFLNVLSAIQNSVDTIGILNGSVPMAQRMALIEKFQKTKGHGVLACQINVGGIGLNLHAASAVILMEPQWKPSSEEQAIARAHRMGQTHSVLVHRLLTRNSVEERMLEILDRKAQIFDEYARDSMVKNASTVATETRFVNEAIDAEIARLASQTA